MKRHIAGLAGPAALEHDAIQIDVRGARRVDLLVQARHPDELNAMTTKAALYQRDFTSPIVPSSSVSPVSP